MMMVMVMIMMVMMVRNADEAVFAAMDHGRKLHAGDTSDMSMTTMGMMMMMMMMTTTTTTMMMMMGRMHHGWKLQGTAGDTFYIISEGDVKVTSSSSASSLSSSTLSPSLSSPSSSTSS